MTRKDLEDAMRQVDAEIDEKKKLLTRMDGYVMGLAKAMSIFDTLRDKLPDESKKKTPSKKK